MAGYTGSGLYDALRGAGFDDGVAQFLATWSLWRQDLTDGPRAPFLVDDTPLSAELDDTELALHAQAAFLASDGGSDLGRWAAPVGDDAWDAFAASVASMPTVDDPSVDLDLDLEVDVELDLDALLHAATRPITDPAVPDLGAATEPQPDTTADPAPDTSPPETDPEPEPLPPPPEPEPEPLPPPPAPVPQPSAPEPVAAPQPTDDLEALLDGPDADGPDVTRQFLDLMLDQTGDAYVFGAEAALDDADPDAFDCSELVQWAGARLGVEIPDGTWNQYMWLKDQGMLIPVEDAIDTPGALLFRFSSEPTRGGGRPSSAHVAVSLGTGETIEARGREYGVGSWEASESRFGFAAVIPQLSDGTADLPSELESMLAVAGPEYEDAAQQDSDLDGLLDALEADMGLDPLAVDSDGDDLSDSFELLTAGTDPLESDTDGDGLDDALELAMGLDALDADSDRDGLLDGTDADGEIIDTDGDRIEDALEVLLGTDPTRLDTDGDGIADGIEYLSGHDPLDPLASSPDPSGNGGPLDDLDDVAGDVDDLADAFDVDDLEATE